MSRAECAWDRMAGLATALRNAPTIHSRAWMSKRDHNKPDCTGAPSLHPLTAPGYAGDQQAGMDFPGRRYSFQQVEGMVKKGEG